MRTLPLRPIRFRLPWGRTYGYQVIPATRAPVPNAGALSRPLPVSGNAAPASAPASRRVIDRQASAAMRQYIELPTILDVGPAPSRILRLTPAMNAGAVQGGTGVGVTGPQSFDPKTDGGSLKIPHLRIPRRPITVTAFRRTYDFSSTVPARGIGAPVKR